MKALKRISLLHRIWLEQLWDVQYEVMHDDLWEGTIDEDGQVTGQPYPLWKTACRAARRTIRAYVRHLKGDFFPKLRKEYEEIVCGNEMHDYFGRGDEPAATSFQIHRASLRDLVCVLKARLICKMIGHDLDAETDEPESGGETIWCNRCDWSTHAWHE